MPHEGKPPATHGPSLARRLLQPLAWIWFVGLVVSVGGAYWLARNAANTAFDRSLRDEASALAARVTWSDRGPLLDVSRQTLELLTWDSADRNAFAMVDIDGNALAGDARVPLPPDHASSFEAPRLFDAVWRPDTGSSADEPVRGAVFTVTSPMIDRRVSIIVVETKRKRAALTRDLRLAVAGPALLLGLFTFVLLSSSVRRGLVPLRRLGEEIALRDVHDWRALPLARVPAEAVPLVARINTLMQDVQDSVALQRRFVADAAHQLRTPVAGIRVLAQELERELVRAFPPGAATGPAGCEESPAQGAAAGWQPLLAELGTTSARMARLIGQLLSLASSETALGFDAEHKPQDIVPLLREATEPLVLQSLRAGRQIELDAPDAPVVARAHPVWLGEVMNNLLDNAQRYGGPHIVMRVAALPEGGAELTVEDDGPGVAYEDLPRLFEPFWRGAEGADRAAAGHNAAGTGLGLAIAREIVERLGGTLSAVSRPQIDGIRFTVRLAA